MNHTPAVSTATAKALEDEKKLRREKGRKYGSIAVPESFATTRTVPGPSLLTSLAIAVPMGGAEAGGKLLGNLGTKILRAAAKGDVVAARYEAIHSGASATYLGKVQEIYRGLLDDLAVYGHETSEVSKVEISALKKAAKAVSLAIRDMRNESHRIVTKGEVPTLLTHARGGRF